MDNNHIVLTSYSGSYGGMEIRMLQEAKLLLETGARVTLVVNEFTGIDKFRENLPNGAALEVLNVPYFLENWHNWRINKFKARFFYKRLFKRLQPDLIHVFLCWTTYGLSHLWGASKNNIPSIFSIHNVFTDDSLPEYIYPHLETCFSSNLGGYGVTASAKDAFARIYPQLKDIPLDVIPNWVDLERFFPDETLRSSTRQALGIGNDVYVMGCIARLAEQKNLMYLIEIFSHLVKQREDIYLLIIGEGPLKEDVEAALKSNPVVADNSQLLGFKANVEDYYRAIDMHTLVSLREGFGISTIEAMASGSIGCVTDIPGSKDVIHSERLGLKVPLNDAKSASKAILDLIEDKERIETIKTDALHEVREQYEQKAVEMRIVEYYQAKLR